MPTPRRQIHLLVQDAAGTIPTTRSVERERHGYEQRRCADWTCRCVLARDNPEPYCSPCQRRIGGILEHATRYASERPDR